MEYCGCIGLVIDQQCDFTYCGAGLVERNQPAGRLFWFLSNFLSFGLSVLSM